MKRETESSGRIPQQILQEDYETLNSLGKAASAFITTGTITSLVVNIFLAASLRLVWKMLGAI